MIIYYNAMCSKCREAKTLLEDNNCFFTIREYLKEPLSKKELREIIALLKCKPIDIVRTSEPLFIEKFKDKKMTDAKWIEALSKYPILIERPIVIDGKKAVIGRPPKLVISLLKKKK